MAIAGVKGASKGRPPKKVQHAVFIKLADYTLDDYWKQILMDCSIAKFPRYVSYKDDLLVYRRGRSASSVALYPNDTGAVDFKRIIDFFRGIGLCSVTDNEINQRRLDDQQKVLQAQKYEVWKDVKKQAQKDTMLQNYINELHERLNLTMKEYQILQSTVSIAVLFKYINASTVVLKDNKISEVVGLLVIGEERGSRTFSFPYSLNNSSSSSPAQSIREDAEPIDQTKTLGVLWIKYLEDLKKKIEWYKSLPDLWMLL